MAKKSKNYQQDNYKYIQNNIFLQIPHSPLNPDPTINPNPPSNRMLNPQLIVWWIWDYSCYGSCTGGGRIGKTVHVGRELGWLIVGGGGGGVVVDKGVREGLILIYPFFVLIFLSQITYIIGWVTCLYAIGEQGLKLVLCMVNQKMVLL